MEQQSRYGAGNLAIDGIRNFFALAARFVTSPITGANNGMNMVMPEPHSRGGNIGFLFLMPVIMPVAIAAAAVGAAAKPVWVAGDALVRIFDAAGKGIWGDTPWLSDALRDANDARTFKYVGHDHYRDKHGYGYDYDS